MKSVLLRFAVPAFCALSTQLLAQPAAAPAAKAPAAPLLHQSIVYLKTAPGKSEDYEKLVRETSMKTAQVRADAGEILSWTLLRSVMPAGSSAQANYIISTLSEGPPPAPLSSAQNEANRKKAGITMTGAEIAAKRTPLVTMVASELWRVRSRVGAPAKGHYIYLNWMKVHDSSATNQFETKVTAPIREASVKKGEMSGWLYATRLLPGGSDSAYPAYTAGMFPNWDAAMKVYSSPTGSGKANFEAVHAGKNYEETMANAEKAREVGRRELWQVVERVEKSKK